MLRPMGMDVEDYFIKAGWPHFCLKEKGSKVHIVPGHHDAIGDVERYLDESGMRQTPKAPVFQSVPRKQFSRQRLDRVNANAMINRRARWAGLPPCYPRSHFPRHWNHQFPGERGSFGDGSGSGSPPVLADHQALLPQQRPSIPGRD